MVEWVCKEGRYQVGHESYNRLHTPCIGVPVLAADSDGKLLSETELRALDKHIKQNYKSEQSDVCRHCGACRMVKPTGEWQYACKCYKDDELYPPEQPTMVSKGEIDLGDGVKRIGEFIDEPGSVL